ncbi:hypothetical protein [Roseinatronobacter sp. S2]|uniref:hypothetical protein n=1 Tax=Roseinatronobacter sp. S2 TaxID=3035471 RepID=UPI00240FCEC5|nr:hypothetical protein [Roseinatronobacter sp. S2]WFE75889.1 hypothetical protein P8S53_05685 [Roseinatronobacter sp. S2]
MSNDLLSTSARITMRFGAVDKPVQIPAISGFSVWFSAIRHNRAHQNAHKAGNAPAFAEFLVNIALKN